MAERREKSLAWEDGAKLQELVQASSDGLTFREASDRLHMPKNAIMGKARRMGLSFKQVEVVVKDTPRNRAKREVKRRMKERRTAAYGPPVPLQPEQARKVQIERQKESQTLRNVTLQASAAAKRAVSEHAWKPERDTLPSLTLPQFMAETIFPSPRQCQYPIGVVRRPGFRFCCVDLNPLSGPYCPEHHAITHKSRGQVRDDD